MGDVVPIFVFKLKKTKHNKQAEFGAIIELFSTGKISNAASNATAQ